MTSKAEQVVSIFQHGRNSAQSVLSVFRKPYGPPREMVLRLAKGMGEGFRQGEIRRAASGGVLVSGLKYGTAKAPAHTIGSLPYDADNAPVSEQAVFQNNAAGNAFRESMDFLTRTDLAYRAPSLLAENG